jgi:hypothetical protein
LSFGTATWPEAIAAFLTTGVKISARIRLPPKVKRKEWICDVIIETLFASYQPWKRGGCNK